MQPMIQRVRHCVLCGGDIASGGRIDRRYCSGSCRTLAYRARLQQHAKEPESIAPPPWSVVRLPPFSSALAALGELQSRIALLTTQLTEQEREHRKELHVGQNSTFAQQPTRREAEAQEAARTGGSRSPSAYQRPIADRVRRRNLTAARTARKNAARARERGRTSACLSASYLGCSDANPGAREPLAKRRKPDPRSTTTGKARTGPHNISATTRAGTSPIYN